MLSLLTQCFCTIEGYLQGFWFEAYIASEGRNQYIPRDYHLIIMWTEISKQKLCNLKSYLSELSYLSLNPAILQITRAALLSNSRWHIVPHVPFTYNSTVPSHGTQPPTSLTPFIRNKNKLKINYQQTMPVSYFWYEKMNIILPRNFSVYDIGSDIFDYS